MNENSKENVRKKIKEKTFVAESLDNNAPVKEIVEYLHSKQKQHKVYNYYCQMLRQHEWSHFRHFLYPGHTLNAFSEEWDGGLNSGYFETFTHKSLMPKVITTKLRSIDKEDPVTAIMHRKNEWNSRWRQYKGFKNVIKEYEWLSDEIIHCPKQFLDMAKHWEKNPDVYFDSAHNWYYGGNGNMNLVSIHGDNYLLHSELDCIYLSPFNTKNLTIEYTYEIAFNCPEDTRILETVISQDIIAIRSKYKVTILKIIENNNDMTIEKLKDMESKLPFTGISFDEYHKNILYVTTIDYKLTIINIDRMSGRSKQLRGKIDTLVDNWSTVIGSERAYYTHVTRNSLTLYDKRTNNAFERWKDLSNIADTRTCNNISVAKYCKGKPLLYIGTNHHLFLIDMRYNKTVNNNLKAIQRWTHGMQCAPTYISICDFEHNKELVSLSSQWCEDMCVVSNCVDTITRRTEIRSVSIPYRPQSVFKTLHQAQKKMLCSNLHVPIQNRLSTAITGLVVFEHGHSYNVLMQNSLGDITSHTMCPNNMMMFFEDDGCEQLDEWSKLYKVEPNDLEVSHIVDISSVWKSLKKVPETYKFGENRFVKTKFSKFNEQDITDTVENEDIDPGLMDIWKSEQTAAEPEEQTASQLFFSCD